MSEENPFSTAPPIPPREMRKGGRPRKRVLTPRQPVHEELRPLSKQAADYAMDYDDDDDDRLKIHRNEIPDGMDYQWVTDSILGQPAPQRRARFERKGWQPVPAARHDGRFMPKGFQGEINVDGLVLMERPMELTIRARQRDHFRATGQVKAKEAQLTGGDVRGVTLDTRHETALRTNKVRKSYERFTPPNED